MSGVGMRQEVERRIAAAAITGCLAKGYTITVYNGEEEVLLDSRDPEEAILREMFTTDEDWLFMGLQDPASSEKRAGFIRFIYGNDGWDVINDYSVNLEGALAEANALADSLA